MNTEDRNRQIRRQNPDIEQRMPSHRSQRPAQERASAPSHHSIQNAAPGRRGRSPEQPGTRTAGQKYRTRESSTAERPVRVKRPEKPAERPLETREKPKTEKPELSLTQKIRLAEAAEIQLKTSETARDAAAPKKRAVGVRTGALAAKRAAEAAAKKRAAEATARKRAAEATARKDIAEAAPEREAAEAAAKKRAAEATARKRAAEATARKDIAEAAPEREAAEAAAKKRAAEAVAKREAEAAAKKRAAAARRRVAAEAARKRAAEAERAAIAEKERAAALITGAEEKTPASETQIATAPATEPDIEEVQVAAPAAGSGTAPAIQPPETQAAAGEAASAAVPEASATAESDAASAEQSPETQAAESEAASAAVPEASATAESDAASAEQSPETQAAAGEAASAAVSEASATAESDAASAPAAEKAPDAENGGKKKKRLNRYHQILIFLLTILLIIVLLVVLFVLPSKRKGAKDDSFMDQIRNQKIRENDVAALDAFFNLYYTALASGNTTELEAMYDVPSKANITTEISTIVNKYDNIKVYVTQGIEEDDIVAFVSNDIHFANIEATAPSVDSFYLTYDPAGAVLRIRTDMYTNPDILKYMNLVSYRDPIRTILADTNDQLNQKLAENKDLNNLYILMQTMMTSGAEELTDEKPDAKETTQASKETEKETTSAANETEKETTEG